MTRFAYLFHIVGFVLWLGGGLASMLIGIRGRREERAVQGAVARLQAALHRSLVIPGALLTVFSGGYLSGPVMRAGAPSAWLIIMQIAGVVAALLVFFVSGPTSVRLARIQPVGETGALFDAVRKKLAVAGSIAGTLGLLSLVAGVLHKY